MQGSCSPSWGASVKGLFGSMASNPPPFARPSTNLEPSTMSYDDSANHLLASLGQLTHGAASSQAISSLAVQVPSHAAEVTPGTGDFRSRRRLQ